MGSLTVISFFKFKHWHFQQFSFHSRRDLHCETLFPRKFLKRINSREAIQVSKSWSLSECLIWWKNWSLCEWIYELSKLERFSFLFADQKMKRKKNSKKGVWKQTKFPAEAKAFEIMKGTLEEKNLSKSFLENLCSKISFSRPSYSSSLVLTQGKAKFCWNCVSLIFKIFAVDFFFTIRLWQKNLKFLFRQKKNWA